MICFELVNIRSNYHSYEQLTELYKNIQTISFESVEIKLIDWFEANFSSVLASILDTNSTNEYKITSNTEKIINILRKNQFLTNYGYSSLEDVNDTTIKLLKLRPESDRFFSSYVVNDLLIHSGMPNLSEGLKKKVAESIYEIFENSKIHSGTEYIYTSGQLYPAYNKIKFSIVDTGLGYKTVINKALNCNFDSVQAIKWALGNGNTTKIDVPGGLGLAILLDFIIINEGKLQIVSDDGFYEQKASEKTFKFLKNPFKGTIVNLVFKTKSNVTYSLATETNNSGDIF